MKKFLTTLSILLAVGIFAHKTQAQSPVSLGIRGGLNFSNLNNVDDTNARTGFMAGAYANIHIPMSPISIQPEVLYTQLGAETDNPGGNENQNTRLKVNLDYIQVPILAKFDFITNGPVTPNVYFGPYVGFNINAEGEVTNGNGSLGGDVDDQIKDTDFGVVVGAGADISKFNIGVRYGAGLTKVFENEDADGKNSVFSIVAGINF